MSSPNGRQSLTGSLIINDRKAATVLTGIHFILTYRCNFECDHCFLYCSPWSEGTFTIDHVGTVLKEAEKIGTVEWIFFEGGEPILYYPMLVEGIRRAGTMGFKVGVVTNAYGALSEEDARLWLQPLAEAGLTYLSISNDAFHYGENVENPAATASVAAGRLGIDTAPICIEPPVVKPGGPSADGKGEPVIGGGAKFRGRAVEKLVKDLPVRPWEALVACPHEELKAPSRVHVDPFGHVHICQGISMGNLWQTPLSEMAAGYDASCHPICGPLIEGGPAELARSTGFAPATGYVDECHMCYTVRKAMVARYPDILAPRQVYGPK
jgi:hypothetical protein